MPPDIQGEDAHTTTSLGSHHVADLTIARCDDPHGAAIEASAPGLFKHFVLDLHNRTILLRLGSWIFVTYGVIAAVGIFVGMATACWYFTVVGLDSGDLATFFLFFLFPSALCGARVFSVLLDRRDLLKKPWQTLWKHGYVLHGGLFGMFVASLLWSLAQGDLRLLLVLFDAGAVGMTICEAILRLGCHVYGCCWGRPTKRRWGIAYTSPDAKINRRCADLHGVRIHPVQLYTLIVCVVLFLALYALLPYKAFDGMLGGIYAITHSLSRWVLEHFRGDDRGTTFYKLTFTKVYSVVCLIAGVICLIVGAHIATNHPIDANISWIDVVALPQTGTGLAVIGLLAAVAFGLHDRHADSWAPPHEDR